MPAAAASFFTLATKGSKPLAVSPQVAAKAAEDEIAMARLAMRARMMTAESFSFAPVKTPVPGQRGKIKIDGAAPAS